MSLLGFRVTCFLLCLQIGVYLASETQPDIDQEMTEYMQKAMVDFRDQMQNGFPDLNIPSLDPWKLSNQSFKVNSEMAKLNLHIPHAEIVGLSSFRTEHFHVSVKQLLVDTHIRFDEIKAEGVYDLDGLFAKLFPLYGQGSFIVHSLHPSISVVLQLDVGLEEIDLKVRSLDIDWSQLKLDFKNLVDGGDMSVLIHRVLPIIGKNLLVAVNPHLVLQLEKALNSFLAEQVKNPSVQEMLQKIIERRHFG